MSSEGRLEEPTDTGWKSLTEAEKQVATLLAEGLTAGEAAERLHISQRNIQAYVDRILSKLSISSNKELARRLATRKRAGL